ncbi:MAG: hypothetical protein A3C07_04275 [Candidatus Sungbacteria bacterium RIFCSPHIGHO2_02_FULL_47_11]|uniref:Uncharacterized protein n=1 Tax=Candidatus Sungbacteria bacterium RIFCSPHIGHO2_02_FULL_47_11 TaxID=1802270 RepID=A0A1G2KLN2_9BACT|nr:MAG: hypothetical protein A3C07_04275 [Candidatus Sungbacteria bacterium RIFCSPHIGHO2_02_FULL_47_11]
MRRVFDIALQEERNAFKLLDRKDPEGVKMLLGLYYEDTEYFDLGVLTALRTQFFERIERAFLAHPYKNIAGAMSNIMVKVDGHLPMPIRFLEKMLMLLDESDDDIGEKDRTSMAICLSIFVPSHPDLLDFYGMCMKERLERLCSEDPDSKIGIVLSNILLKVKKRFKDRQEQSQSE